MGLLLTKYAVTALVVVAVSELVKVSGRLGAFVAAMPLVTLMVMVWMRVEKQEMDRIAEYGLLTFWYVLPTLPMFLLTPWMLHRGHGFTPSILAGLALTGVCFAVTALVARRFGMVLVG